MLHIILRPFSESTNPRLAQGRCELVEQLVARFPPLSHSDPLFEHMMAFAIRALSHPSLQVREVAEQILLSLYRLLGTPVRQCLVPESTKTTRNFTYKKVFEEFEKIDKEPTSAQRQPRRQRSASADSPSSGSGRRDFVKELAAPSSRSLQEIPKLSSQQEGAGGGAAFNLDKPFTPLRVRLVASDKTKEALTGTISSSSSTIMSTHDNDTMESDDGEYEAVHGKKRRKTCPNKAPDLQDGANLQVGCTVLYTPTDNQKIDSLSKFRLTDFLNNAAPGMVTVVRVNKARNILAVDVKRPAFKAELLKVTKLCTVPVRAYLPREHSGSFGVLRDIDPDHTENDIRTQLQSSIGIVEVKRLGRTSPVVRVTFAGEQAPQHVKVGLVRTEVIPYRARPLQCYKCYKFGHIAAACTTKSQLRHRCGKSHDGMCEGVPYCVNCEGCACSAEETNDKFNAETLNYHYWTECPMLMLCYNCKQVVEISGLTRHLLEECVSRTQYRLCIRCKEAIAKTRFDGHVKLKTCVPAKPPHQANHCPLCHQNFAPGDDSWKVHLMSEVGCAFNPRRRHKFFRWRSGSVWEPDYSVAVPDTMAGKLKILGALPPEYRQYTLHHSRSKSEPAPAKRNSGTQTNDEDEDSASAIKPQ
ncbi:hypothetical protein HPB47_012125 [Ixodes persulcatus]|uniref:Uncharacterized protein n=1 Tax=Ixodes persulcatus TaxID=34615 RepID=A0AC60NUD4_IXOPE|nr:hypothetical protein HPB47_012125 [Ixodes persulcatus]